ncbi:MAG TPA: flagellar hook-basal body complex protein FliE [archaeon]|nr:flagellar hook-basal body complex protein FliE [archaeon]
MAEFRIEATRPELPQIRPLRPGVPQVPAAETLPAEAPKEISFRESIRNFVHDVDGMQKDAGKKVQDFMAGEISDVHDVMVAVEKAETSFQLLMELRNKMLDAYKEIKQLSV